MSRKKKKRNRQRAGVATSASAAKVSPPAEPDVGGRERVHVEARSLWEARKYKEAGELLLTLRPLEPFDRYSAACAFNNAGAWDEAWAAIEPTLQAALRPYFFVEAARARAGGKSHYSWSAEQKTEITTCLEKAAESPSCEAWVLVWLAEIDQQYTPEGRARRRVLLERAVAAEPNDRESRMALSSLLGFEGQEPAAGFAIIEPLLPSGDQDPELLWRAVELLTSAGDFSRALLYLDRIAAIEDELKIALTIVRGDLLTRTQDPRRALDQYREVASAPGATDRQRMAANFGIARACYMLGQDGAAVQPLREALSGFMNSSTRPDLHDLTFPVPDLDGSYLSPAPEIACATAVARGRHGALDDETYGRACFLSYLHQTPDGNGGAEVDRPELGRLLRDAAQFSDTHLYADEMEQWSVANRQYAASIRWRLRADLHDRAEEKDRRWEYECYSVIPFPDLTTIEWRDVVEAICEALAAASPGVAVAEVSVGVLRKVYPHMIEAKLFDQLVTVARAVARASAEADSLPFFVLGFALNELRDLDGAEAAYRRAIAIDPSSAALLNLSLITEGRGRVEEAFQLVTQAIQLDPKNRKAANRHAALRGRAEEARRRDNFLRTAIQRYPALDRYKRQLLAALEMITGFRGWPELASFTGIDEKYLPGHWRKLVEMGMIIEGDGSFSINEHVRPLLGKENSHAIATRVIRADPSIAMKPIFNSRMEYTVYGVLIGLFPNHLVFPNMALQSIFQYDRMKEMLQGDDFGYMLRAHVDFCVTSTSHYFPIVAFELDSPYHDAEPQRIRDERKDRIFKVGGVPLCRLRPWGQPTGEAIRHEVARAVCELRAELLRTDEQAIGLLRDLDFDTLASIAAAKVPSEESLPSPNPPEGSKSP